MYVSIEYCQLSDKIGFCCNAKELVFASAEFMLFSHCFTCEISVYSRVFSSLGSRSIAIDLLYCKRCSELVLVSVH